MKRKRIIWGIVILLLGVYFLVAQFVPNFPEISIFKALIAIGLLSITISSVSRMEFFGMLLPLSIIVIMFKSEISKLCGINVRNIKEFTIIAATFLLCIGLNMLFGDLKKKNKKKKIEKKMGKSFTYYTDDIIDGKGVFVDEDSTIERDDGDFVNYEVTFGSAIKYLDSQNLKRVNLECSFGEMKVYFDKAKVADVGANINIDVSFGRLVMYIPKEWQVINNVDTTFSGIKEHGTSIANETKVYLTGDVTFAGAEIFYI